MAKTKKSSNYVSILWFVTMMLLLMIAYFFLSNRANLQLADLARQESNYRLRILELEKEEKSLEERISLSQTDSFIENEARSRYGFLKPGEIRFEITNPEALYNSYYQNPAATTSSND